MARRYIHDYSKRYHEWIIMEDFQVLVGILASGSIAINIYLIKSVATLCEKVARLEGKLSRT